MMKRLLTYFLCLALLPCLITNTSKAQSIKLFNNLNTADKGVLSSLVVVPNDQAVTILNNKAYFWYGYPFNLACFDGVKVSLVTNNTYNSIGALVVCNGYLYFTANDQLYQSDGSSIKAVTLPPPVDSNYPVTSARNLFVYNNCVYFDFLSEYSNTQLAKFDGTSAIVIANPANPEFTTSFSPAPTGSYSVANGNLYVSYTCYYQQSPNVYASYVEMATVANDVATLINNPTVHPAYGPYSAYSYNLATGLNSDVYFQYQNISPDKTFFQYQLARYNGINTSVIPLAGAQDVGIVGSLSVVNNNLYFPYQAASTTLQGAQLAQFNGSTLKLIPNINTGFGGCLGNIIPYNGNLYFQYLSAQGIAQLAKFDGTSTTLIPNVSPSDPGYGSQLAGSDSAMVTPPIVANGKLYFQYQNSLNVNHLAQYDGATLSLVTNPDQASGYSGYPFLLNGNLYFQYRNQSGNFQLGELVIPTAPVISTVSPASGKAGSTVVLTGSNFTGATAVSIGGIPVTSFIVNSATKITAVVGAGFNDYVSVTNATGTAMIEGFQFTNPPVITSFSPTTGAKGTMVAISGKYLSKTTKASFGGVATDLIQLFSDTLIYARVTTGATGAVALTTPYGVTSAAGFTYIKQPTITSASPLTAAAGATVIITGNNFLSADTVAFGGVQAASFTVNSNTQITAVVAAGASGNITVQSPGGTGSLGGFTYLLPQTISFGGFPTEIYGLPDINPGATASSGLPVSYSSSNTGVATIVNGMIHITGAGTTTITASQSGNNTYNSASPVNQVFTVAEASQSMIFNPIGPVGYGTPDFDPGATTTSGLPIVYTSSDIAIANIVNGLVHLLKPGTVTITASQPGNGNYAPATQISQKLTVTKGNQTITFAGLPAAGYGGAAIVASATASSGLAVTLSSSDTTVIKVSGLNLQIKGLGTATITANQAGNIDYLAAAPVSQPITVSKGSQAITFTALAAKTYGAADFTLIASASSKLAVSFTSSDNTVATVSGTLVHIVSPGTAIITANQAGNINYLAAAPASQTLTVNPASQTITFAALAARNYGAADFTLAATSSSKLAVSYTSSDAGVATVTGTSVHIVSAGAVTITASQQGNADYSAANPVSQTLTISKAAQTITFAALAAKAYGAADYALTAAANSKLPVSYSSSNVAVATIVNGSVHIVGVGSSTISASQAGNANYVAATAVSQALTINKAALTIKPDNQTIIYGAPLPAFTATYTGFVNGENNTVLTAQPTITTTATAASPAGNYPITAGAAAAANYSISYAAGTLTIGKASQSITFAALPSANYGGAAIAASATASSGLVVTLTSSDTTVIKVSGKTLTIKGIGTATITANQAGGVNYLAAAPVSQTLTVGKGSQTIAFTVLAAKTYGTANFVLTATASSKLAVSYTSSDPTVAAVSGTTVQILSAGSVTITANQAGNADYLAAAPVSQTLTINQAAQTITFAALATKTYGAADFALAGTANSKLAVTYSSANPAVATIVNGTVHILGAGTSVITASQPGNTNYATATAVTQTLTVNKATLTIKGVSQTITYGAALPALTVTYTGFVNNETSTVLGTQPTVTTTATAASPAGNYPIAASGAAAANYTITYSAGTLTISKAAQTITFAALPSARYGDAAITATATASSGLGVTLTSSDTTIIKVSGKILTIKGVGAVTITASQAGGANYLAATSVNQTLTVGQGAQTITFAALASKTYGAVNTTLTAAASSKLAINYTSSNTAVATITGGAIHIVGAGTTVIMASQPGNTDYLAATAVTQTLTVNKAPLTIKAVSQTMTAGSAIPALTVTYTGFVNGDTNASLGTQPTITTTATTSSPAGNYPITVSSAFAANYTITYTAATLTIKAAGNIPVTADAQPPSVSVNKDEKNISFTLDPRVRQAVSPNGDGINDVLVIDNISNFPDNRLVVMDRNGVRIFEADHYDNLNNAFDGHSTITGHMQLPGTYFYLLEYKAAGVTQRKTGFVVLKY